MNTYEKLLDTAAKEDIYVIEKALFSSHSLGLINGDVIGLNTELKTDTERACILAEELGHYYTSSGDIIDQDYTMNRKQEHHARMWAYDMLLPLPLFILAFKHGCQSVHETADFLEVSEEFLRECVKAYYDKYGPFLKYNDYLFIFSENGLNISKAI